LQAVALGEGWYLPGRRRAGGDQVGQLAEEVFEAGRADDLDHPRRDAARVPAQRLRAGLSDLHRFYRAAEPMLTNVRRDRAAVPGELRERTDATDASYRDALLQVFAVRGPRRRRLRAVLGHAVSFWTWRSLCLDQHMSDPEAVRAMTTLVLATADGSDSRWTASAGQ